MFSAATAWIQQHKRISALEDRTRQRIRIGRLERSVWPFETHGHTGAGYYFSIINLSETESLDNVRVDITSIAPDINYSPPPLPMHVKDDSYKTREFSINAGADRQIDIVTGPVRHPNCSQGFCIVHTVTDEQRLVPDQSAKYRIAVRATAKNAPPATAIFEAWVGDGELQCIAL